MLTTFPIYMNLMDPIVYCSLSSLNGAHLQIRVVERNPMLGPINSLRIYLITYAWIREQPNQL